jgi:hypothetical protein
MPSRLSTVVASAIVALALAVPSYAQGKSGGKKPGKGPTRPPGSGTVSPTPSPQKNGSSPGSQSPGSSGDAGVNAVLATTTPFAWLDDASVLDPGNVWVGVSIARWQGSGLSQTVFPVVDTAYGLTPRVQLGASVPREAGGLGTMFFGAKVAVFTDDIRELQVAVGPTLEITEPTVPGQGRVEWGLPVSAHIDRGSARIYTSVGYFSPGIWYAGAGVGMPLGGRIGVSLSFSNAWTTSPEPAAGVASSAGPHRNELSGGVSYDLKPNIAVFASLSRTLGVSAEDGAGTTLGFGLSWSAAALPFRRP